ncbi:hypothetical protein BGZ83_004366 [Gryganskiella cystojenkinii]|nr:hypothetical protein BGZ83_004366 [Gryganskiella cystojenkinii]
MKEEHQSPVIALEAPQTTETQAQQLSQHINQDPHQDLPHFTWRSVVVGIFIGTLLCFTNMYFGLQTGWISMMSLQSSLLGFAMFKAARGYLKTPFGPAENIILQSVAVATGTMPLAAGFVGIIPALQMLTVEDNPASEFHAGGPIFLSAGQMILWSLAIAFFGVFIAVPLRRQVVIKEKLPFPSGTATAQMIGVLHNVPLVTRGPVRKVQSSDSDSSNGSSNEGLRKRRAFNPDGDEEQALETEEKQPHRSFSSNSHPLDEFPPQQPLGHVAPVDYVSHDDLQPQEKDPRDRHQILNRPDAVEIKGENGERFTLGQDFVQEENWRLNMWALGLAFTASAVYTILQYFFPVVSTVPVFDWLSGMTVTVASTWQWFLTPSLSYVGQGVIMGFPTTASMLLGCIVGWGILSPVVTNKKWVTGPVGSSTSGARGWILWISLGVMIAEAVVSLLGVIVLSLIAHYRRRIRTKRREARRAALEASAAQTGADIDAFSVDNEDEEDDDAPIDQLVPLKIWVCGLILSCALCLLLIWVVFRHERMPVYATLLAVVLGCLLSVLGVRALGSTDLNPVSGIGKVSQFVFAGVVPGGIVANLIAGGIAEAGAQQAGDLMQDLKTGHLLGASPKAQFWGQLIGSLASVFISTGVFKLYSNAYKLPGPEFAVPTAKVWLDLAHLVNGHSLPYNTTPFIWSFAAFFGILTLITVVYSDVAFLKSRGRNGSVKGRPRWVGWIPSGIAFAIGMYNLPNFTLARFVGGVVSVWWDWHCKRYANHPSAKYAKLGRVFIIIVASGFVLGEGTFSIVNLILKTAKVHSTSCVGCYAGACSCLPQEQEQQQQQQQQQQDQQVLEPPRLPSPEHTPTASTEKHLSDLAHSLRSAVANSSGLFGGGILTSANHASMYLNVHPVHWVHSVYNQHRYGNYVISDRQTFATVWEDMPVYTRIGMHLLFATMIDRKLLETHKLQHLFSEESLNQGRHFDAPESVSYIPHFIKTYNLDLSELLEQDLSKYPCFNAFFYRKLKDAAREVAAKDDPNVITSAADCRLCVFESIEASTKIWIKGHSFTLSNLLQDQTLAQSFEGGSIAIFRLAPQDYHRFHSPVQGSVAKEPVKIGGTYFTVNPMAVNEDLNVFTENVRMVNVINLAQRQDGGRNEAFDQAVFVAIGALLVGSIDLTGAKDVGNSFNKGDELGYFAYGGSTCILLFKKGAVQFDNDLLENSQKGLETLVKTGEHIGVVRQQ